MGHMTNLHQFAELRAGDLLPVQPGEGGEVEESVRGIVAQTTHWAGWVLGVTQREGVQTRKHTEVAQILGEGRSVRLLSEQGAYLVLLGVPSVRRVCSQRD